MAARHRDRRSAGVFVALIAGSSLRPQFAAATLPEPAAWSGATPATGAQVLLRGRDAAVSRPALAAAQSSAPANNTNKTVPQHVDDEGTAPVLEPVVSAIGPVTDADDVQPGVGSARRRPIPLSRNHFRRPRYLDPALHRPRLIAARRAFARQG